MEVKTIHVRKTRPGERFNAMDRYIAWLDGQAAGAMGPTEEQAIGRLLAPGNLVRLQQVETHGN